MIDSAEKVRIIEALKNCLDRPKCRDCPWHECEDVYGDGCAIPRSLAEKALALVELLKEQEPVEPILKREGWNKYYNDYVCPICDQELVYEQNYCSECGRAVKWEI